MCKNQGGLLPSEERQWYSSSKTRNTTVAFLLNIKLYAVQEWLCLCHAHVLVNDWYWPRLILLLQDVYLINFGINSLLVYSGIQLVAYFTEWKHNLWKKFSSNLHVTTFWIYGHVIIYYNQAQRSKNLGWLMLSKILSILKTYIQSPH